MSSASFLIRLADVLQRAGVRRGADELAFRCADGYTSALSLDDARDPSVLLAIGQNGRPLTRDHGFPCRLRVPSLYGMKNPKWLQRIELRRSHLSAYWVKRGWSDRAVVRTSSRIEVATDAGVGQPPLDRGSGLGRRQTDICGGGLRRRRQDVAARATADAPVPAGMDPVGLPLHAHTRGSADDQVPRDRRHGADTGPSATPAPPIGSIRIPRGPAQGHMSRSAGPAAPV